MPEAQATFPLPVFSCGRAESPEISLETDSEPSTEHLSLLPVVWTAHAFPSAVDDLDMARQLGSPVLQHPSCSSAGMRDLY